jgi:hypothetical protein
MDDGISEHLYRNSDHVVCPLVRIHTHASKHASSSTSQMSTRYLQASQVLQTRQVVASLHAPRCGQLEHEDTRVCTALASC